MLVHEAGHAVHLDIQLTLARIGGGDDGCHGGDDEGVADAAEAHEYHRHRPLVVRHWHDVSIPHGGERCRDVVHAHEVLVGTAVRSLGRHEVAHE